MASPLRTEQAEQTRRRIANAARDLFAADGYGATSIKAIAKAAGVAVPTVYKTFGTKVAIASELNALIDETADLATRIEATMTAETGRDVVIGSVRIGRALHDACGDIIVALGAAGSSTPELAELAKDGMNRHVDQVRAAAGRIADLGDLRPDLTVTYAAGLLSQLSSVQAFTTLVGEHGWTVRQCEDRLVDAACRILLR